MNIVLFYFLLLIVLPAILIVWGVRIIRSFINKQDKSKTRFIEAIVYAILVSSITWNIGIFPISKNFYVKQQAEQITGKTFWSWKEFAFEEVSVRGEGYSIYAYKYGKEIAQYFLNPDKSFFNNYPVKPDHRKNWESIKWKSTPVQMDEKNILKIATPSYAGWNQSKLDKMKFIENLANQTGNYYAYNSNGSDVDFYIINPENRLFVMINHNQ